MVPTKCVECREYFEDSDIQKVDNRLLCYNCVNECKNCHSIYSKDFDSEYCYNCLEGNLV